MATILLITDRVSTTERLRPALARAGFDVFVCRGPRPPHDQCAEPGDHTCALSELASAVVLDADLATDALEQGLSSRSLVCRYRGLGLPVVVLTRADEQDAWIRDTHTTVLPRRTEPDEVAAAIDELLADASAGRRHQPDVRAFA